MPKDISNLFSPANKDSSSSMQSAHLWMSWSSGKDSAMALHHLRQNTEFDVSALFTTVNAEFDRVAMHAVRRQLLQAQAEALGLPLHCIELPFPCSNEVYEEIMSEFIAKAIKANVQYIGFGDLFLEDIRQYREKMMETTPIKPIFPLWQQPTGKLARQMLDKGIKAILTCIDPSKLSKEFVGREFNAELIADLPREVDPCGENGEFHTFVYDAPGFQAPINVRVGEIVERDGFVFADVSPVQSL